MRTYKLSINGLTAEFSSFKEAAQHWADGVEMGLYSHITMEWWVKGHKHVVTAEYDPFWAAFNVVVDHNAGSVVIL